MWLRPRTEILPPDVRWWEFHDDTKQSVIAVGFGLLNLVYVRQRCWRSFECKREASAHAVRSSMGGLLVSFLLLRSAFLGTLENRNRRYTLECYPAIIVLASSLLSRRDSRPRLSRGKLRIWRRRLTS